MYYGQEPPMVYGNQFGAPSPYGSMNDVEGCGGGKSLGVTEKKGPFLRGQRRRLNIQPVFLCVLGPWALFTAVYALLSFSIRYESPGVCYSLLAVLALIVAAVGVMGLSASGRWFANAEREPTWLIFIFGSMFVAFVAGCSLGSANYSSNMRRYFNMRNLNNYTDVDPSKMRGQQLMDAGIIQFTPGTRLDISKSMGFKNNNIFCVAPIIQGDTPLATYDFWVVGKDCCSGNQANFHCENFNNPYANGGLRLMTDSDRAFYRLAVQQAEATYDIKAVHPLFFEWSVEPITIVEGWKQSGRSDFLVCILSYFVFQTFVVAVATLAFAKMGHF